MFAIITFATLFLFRKKNKPARNDAGRVVNIRHWTRGRKGRRNGANPDSRLESSDTRARPTRTVHAGRSELAELATVRGAIVTGTVRARGLPWATRSNAFSYRIRSASPALFLRKHPRRTLPTPSGSVFEHAKTTLRALSLSLPRLLPSRRLSFSLMF